MNIYSSHKVVGGKFSPLILHSDTVHGNGSFKKFQEQAGEAYSQPTFTCWKSAIETLEKGVKYVQS